MNPRKLVSVIVPVYSEEKIIPEFYRRTTSVLDKLAGRYDHEILFVDDGSRDGTAALLRDLCRNDPRVKAVFLSRNFGHQFAITAGLDHVRGDAAVIIDGDLQDPPEVIPEMINKWEEGNKVVFGIREKRRGENVFKLLTAKIFYRLIRLLSDIRIPVDAGDFRLLDRRVVLALRNVREENRYLRGLVSWTGFAQVGVSYRRDPRFAGKTKFTLKKMVRFAFDGILSFSDKPLKITAYIGFLITLASFLMAGRVLIGKIRHPEVLVSGWTSLILAVLFIGGIQMISLGILGLYLGRQYREVKKRPLYIVADTANLGEDGAEAGSRDEAVPAP
ncbi:MAG: glycosyltransferase family 2 protein [Acidobacteriota bacterium]|nr:glycosyltransferase family 2 protein [Acidobacteriota bacterium]